jgi:hypothetical protein
MKQAMEVVIVSRYALTLIAEFTSYFVPASETVNDYDLIPEGSRRFDCGHFGHGQVQTRRVDANIWLNEHAQMWIEGRLRAALDAYGGTHVPWLRCGD